MSYRILTKNAVENTNIDGARDHNFNAGRRSGIVKGALNSGNLFLSANNTIALDTCELRLCGHRVVIDSAEYKTFYNQPSVPIRYSLVAQIIVSNNGESVSFDLKTQSSTTPLVQNDLDKNINGTYELEIGRFTQLTDGTLTDVVRTADLITGGAGGGNSEYIRIGTVTTNKISPELDADVDIENTINPDDNKPQTNFTFNLPTSVGTVVSVNGEEKTSINTDITPIASSENLITSGGVHDYPAVTFAESERQKSKNLFPYETVSGNTSTQKFFNPLSAGTYTLSAIVSSASPDTQCLVEVYYNNTWLAQYFLTKSSIRTSETRTINSQFDELRFYGGKPNYAYDFTFSQVQLEQGSVATDYQPYNGAIVHEKNLIEKSMTLIDKIYVPNETYSQLRFDNIPNREGNYKLIVIGSVDTAYDGSIKINDTDLKSITLRTNSDDVTADNIFGDTALIRVDNGFRIDAEISVTDTYVGTPIAMEIKNISMSSNNKIYERKTSSLIRDGKGITSITIDIGTSKFYRGTQAFLYKLGDTK